MKLRNIFFLLLTYTVTCCLTACDNDDDISPSETGSIRIEFDARAGEEDLELNKDYVNASSEIFAVTKLNYYISNIRLKTNSGQEYVVPQDSSYFLIMEEHEESQTIAINNVPAGDYNEITFIVGVDSLRSTMDISRRTGVLDPAQGHDGMYWVWNSGYIFFKMEGTSPSAPGPENKFYYHIGGFGGYDARTINNIREVTVSMGNMRAEVRAAKSPKVHLHADVLELFKNPAVIKIAEHPTVMLSGYSTTVSGNYVNMFRFDHVHN